MVNNLKINKNGTLLPKYPSNTFDKRYSIISDTATNMNSSPLFYIGPRVNTLWSSTSPNAPDVYAVMRYGKKLNYVFGDLENSSGTLNPNMYDVFTLNIDSQGNYKLHNNTTNKKYKVYFNKYGSYINLNNKKMYFK